MVLRVQCESAQLSIRYDTSTDSVVPGYSVRMPEGRRGGMRLDSKSGDESGWIGRGRRFRRRHFRLERRIVRNRVSGGDGFGGYRGVSRDRSRFVQSQIAFAAVAAPQALRAKVIIAGVFGAAGTNLHRRFATNTANKRHGQDYFFLPAARPEVLAAAGGSVATTLRQRCASRSITEHSCSCCEDKFTI